MYTMFWFNVSCLWLCLLPGVELAGQNRIYGYLDMGSNNVSDGPFINTAGLATYEFGKYQVGAGFKLDLVSHNENMFSGFTLDGSRQVLIKTFPLNIKGFYLLNIHNELLIETNWGILIQMGWDHFCMNLGNGFRSIAFTKNAIDLYGYQKYEKLRENWNLVHFFVNQETNPFLRLIGKYEAGATLETFLEAWYQTAGAFNLSVNYFGFFFRTGVIWEIR